jgi:hypothetical protein
MLIKNNLAQVWVLTEEVAGRSTDERNIGTKRKLCCVLCTIGAYKDE